MGMIAPALRLTDLDLVLDICPTGPGIAGPTHPIQLIGNRAPLACRCVPAGAEGVDACVRHGDDARQAQGFAKFPATFRAWLSAMVEFGG